jgi:hypothetical protein
MMRSLLILSAFFMVIIGAGASLWGLAPSAAAAESSPARVCVDRWNAASNAQIRKGAPHLPRGAGANGKVYLLQRTYQYNRTRLTEPGRCLVLLFGPTKVLRTFSYVLYLEVRKGDGFKFDGPWGYARSPNFSGSFARVTSNPDGTLGLYVR